ncbi:FIVAR domain-containing protein [Paenibacillus sp. IB182496]|uniref:FIVAR domain-containing protein n=1 Tax=Paenibacillus sabuli TaxID=2772509 RepID=A0A927GSU3_9BACL|nr:S-layer homology domain-containing protein [Paenibacillus sabuli]MBD2847124.1 FIVAR domain-containing protein [Paenibacillus sabuli]
MLSNYGGNAWRRGLAIVLSLALVLSGFAIPVRDMAKAAPDADKSALQEKFDAILNEDLNPEAFTTATWDPFESAAQTAYEVMENEAATQQEVDDALSDLNSTYDALERVPLPVLESAVVANPTELVLTFDEPVDVKDKLNGFMVNVKNEELELDEELELGAYTFAEELLTITLITAIDVDDTVTVVYDEASGNLITGNELALELDGFEQEADNQVVVDPSTLTDRAAEIQGQVDDEVLVEADYTDASWQALTDALDQAQAVLDAYDEEQAEEMPAGSQVTQRKVDGALAELNAAYDALVGTAALTGRYTAIMDEQLAQADYTSGSWPPLTDALTAAGEVLDDPAAVQADVDAVLADLNTAYDGLVRIADLRDKRDAIADEALVEAYYTPASWSALAEALTTALTLLADAGATQQAVDEALAALATARDGLVDLAAPVLLSVAVTSPTKVVLSFDEAVQASDLAGFVVTVNDLPVTPAGYEAQGTKLTLELSEAVDADAVVAVAYDAASGHLTGITGLAADDFDRLADNLLNVDRQALQALIVQIEAASLQAVDYSAASWQGLQQALEEADDALLAGNATQQQVDAALEALQAAYDGLVDLAALQALAAAVGGELDGGMLLERDYTAQSWQRLVDALDAAETVLGDPEATQQAADEARTELDAAYSGLQDMQPPVLVSAQVTSPTKVLLTFDQQIQLTNADGFTLRVDGSIVPPAGYAVQGEAGDALALFLPRSVAEHATVTIAYVQTRGSLRGMTELATRGFNQAVEVRFVMDGAALTAKLDAIADAMLEQADYAPASWAALQAARTAAQAVLDDPAATQQDADQALTELNAAYAGLKKLQAPRLKRATLVAATELALTFDQAITVADLDGLTIRINGEAATPGGYEATGETLVLELPAALNADAAVRVIYDAAAGHIQGATGMAAVGFDERAANWLKVNKAALQAEVDEIERNDLSEAKYTPASWTVLADALADARAVLADAAATQRQATDALSALQAAHAGLEGVPAPVLHTVELTGSRTLELRFAVTVRLDNLSGFAVTIGGQAVTPTGYALDGSLLTLTLPGAYDAAAQAAIAYEAGAGNLRGATGLPAPSFDRAANNRLTVDKSALRDRLSAIAAEELSATAYTSESWSALGAARKVAEAVLGDPGATQQEVNEALGELGQARAGLTRRTSGGAFIPYFPPATSTETIPADPGAAPGSIVIDVALERTRADGRVTDQVELGAVQVQAAITKALEREEARITVLVPDDADTSSEATVTVPQSAVRQLIQRGIELEIRSPHGVIIVPADALDGQEGGFYFRLVPMRGAAAREALQTRARAEQAVRAAGGDAAEAIARPMKIETDLQSGPVTLVLPLTEGDLPSSAEARAQYLSGLVVYIEHSQGDAEVARGEAVVLEDGRYGVQFANERFSTFTILRLPADDAPAYMSGYPDGTFHPDRMISRAEMAVLLSRLAELDEAGAALDYADVDAQHWAASAIAQAHAAGLMSGDPNGGFRPEAGITRAEMAAVVANMLELEETPDRPFADVPTSHWASGAIAAVRAAGIMSGYPDGRFAPHDTLTRAEAATILNRVFERSYEPGTAERPIWPDVPATHWAYAAIMAATSAQ